MSDMKKHAYSLNDKDLTGLTLDIKTWGKQLGFQQIAISDINLAEAEKKLQQWIADGYHGDMSWMASHGSKRTHPEELHPGTIRVITARMDYLPPATADSVSILENRNKAFISRYTLGRDYHKVMRQRLQKLATQITKHVGDFGYRVFVDSAPVMEKALAEKSGLGWIGKHSNVLNKDAGSWFFLGEIYIDIPLPVDSPVQEHCGTCTSCIDVCPTRAIVRPYHVDARLCISYLTIELKGSIPEALRAQIGNRIYGCDDCQLYCPWNRFATVTSENDFFSRHQLDDISLLELFDWDEKTFLTNTEGSAIRRIGYERWLRNIAVALGNAETSSDIINALQQKLNYPSALVVEHANWALQQHLTGTR